MGQKSFINILLIRNILLQAVFSKAELLANASPRETETHVLLSGTRCWKIWEFISKPQPLMLGWGILFPVSTFMFFLCYFYIHPQHTHNMQNLVSYTKALLGCTIAFSVAPGRYSTKCPVLFPLFIMSLLAMGQIRTRKLPDLGSFWHTGCPSVHACHWGTVRRLLLGCCIQNGMSYKAKQS